MDAKAPEPAGQPPPLGAWWRLYLLVLLLAALVMLLLWLFTARYHLPTGRP